MTISADIGSSLSDFQEQTRKEIRSLAVAIANGDIAPDLEERISITAKLIELFPSTNAEGYQLWLLLQDIKKVCAYSRAKAAADALNEAHEQPLQRIRAYTENASQLSLPLEFPHDGDRYSLTQTLSGT